MQKFFGIFVDSAKEFKNLKSVIMAALLVALHTVFAMFLIELEYSHISSDVTSEIPYLL